MIRSRRLLLLLVPLALGLASAAGPGRAQTIGNSRFAFADTTLLRDTLGLRFDRLFELSDSLGMLPDTLRALSIRYQFLPSRLIALADSLRVPVDSVGVVLERERFNPLNTTVERVDELQYTSFYSVDRNQTRWRNNGDFRIVRGPLFVHNITGVESEQYPTSRGTGVRRRTNAETEVGWRVHPTTSIGGRAVLYGFKSDDASTGDVQNTTNNYQVSMRTRHKPSERVSAELNAFTGLKNEDNRSRYEKGSSSELNGAFTWLAGDWMTNDFYAQLTGNSANILLRRTGKNQDARDIGQNYRGNVTLFPQGRVNFSSDFSYRDFRNQEEDTAGVLQPVRTANADLNMGLRTRIDNDRTLNLTQQLGWGDNASALRSGQRKSALSSTAAQARYRLYGTSLESNFNLDFSENRTPTLSPTGGYREKTETRRLEGVASRQLTSRITVRATARISLARFRYAEIGSYKGLPGDHDQTQQQYRIEGSWTASRDFNTSLGLDVQRSELIYIPGTSVSLNNQARTYRADWSWTYRLFSMLTVSQRNGVNASYTAYRFNQASDRLALDYSTTTTLNAVLTPRLTLDLTHNSQQQPSGGWVYHPELGGTYFEPADENRNYQLGARASYTPVTGLTLVVEPRYRSSNRYGNDEDGNQVPQKTAESLTIGGSVNLNLSVGRRGRVAGVIGPRYEANGDRSFSKGVPQPTKVTETQDWTGSLQFSWTL